MAMSPHGSCGLLAGGFPAWPLPLDETCAGFARSVVKSLVVGLGMTPEVTYDVAVAVSELATNVHVHASGRGIPASAHPELWAYVRWCTRPELVIKVYDAAPWRGPIIGQSLRPPPASEGGRGFEVVSELAAEHGGSWGLHRSRSRLGAIASPGKVAYFSVPLPLPMTSLARSQMPRRHSKELAEAIGDLLTERDLGPAQIETGFGMSVVCLRPGVHVWIREDASSCITPNQETTRYPPLDVIEIIEIIEQITRYCEDLNAAQRGQPTGDGRRPPPSNPG